jgi:hypothetical protein
MRALRFISLLFFFLFDGLMLLSEYLYIVKGIMQTQLSKNLFSHLIYPKHSRARPHAHKARRSIHFIAPAAQTSLSRPKATHLIAGIFIAAVISSPASASSLATCVTGANDGLDAMVRAIELGPAGDANFRKAVADGVADIKTKFNNAVTSVQTTMIDFDTFNYLEREFPEFLKFLIDKRQTIAGLQAQSSALVLINQSTMPTTPTLANIQHLYLVGTRPTFNITDCTSLKTLGFFDGAALTDTQRTQISTLAKGGTLQNLFVMNWGNNDILEYAFLSTALVDVIIDRVSTLRTGAFRDSKLLRTVSIPSARRSCGAFVYCYALTTALFPLIEILDSDEFYYCYNLTAAIFPLAKSIGKVTTEYGTFEGCTKLTTIDFSSAESIGARSFMYTKITSAYFPKATYFGKYAFRNCSSLRQITYPDTDVTFEPDVFYDCSDLTHTMIPRA